MSYQSGIVACSGTWSPRVHVEDGEVHSGVPNFMGARVYVRQDGEVRVHIELPAYSGGDSTKFWWGVRKLYNHTIYEIERSSSLFGDYGRRIPLGCPIEKFPTEMRWSKFHRKITKWHKVERVFDVCDEVD